MEKQFYKVTFNVARDVTVNMKEKFWKKAKPVTLQQNDKIMLNRLESWEAEMCKAPFVQKLVGMFVGGVVTSVKLEEENGN